MKRGRGILAVGCWLLAISCWLLAVGGLQAQSFVGLGAGAGFVQMADDLPQTSSLLGGGGEAGAVYEWQRGGFLLRTGIYYQFQCPVMAVDSQWLSQEMIDTRGMPVTFRGLLTNRKDKMVMHRLTVPVMVGGTWRGWYALGGVQVSIALACAGKQSAELMTAGDYQGRYYEWFENMPNHGYHDFEPVVSSHAMEIRRIDVRLAAETGYTFRLNPYTRRACPLLRVGLFAEYGLLNLHSKDCTQPRSSTDWSQYLHVEMNHLYNSDESNGAGLNGVTYGIRLTILFPISNARERQWKCRCER